MYKFLIYQSINTSTTRILEIKNDTVCRKEIVIVYYIYTEQRKKRRDFKSST